MANWRVLTVGVGLGLMLWAIAGCREEPKRQQSPAVDEAEAQVLKLKAEADAVANAAAVAAKASPGQTVQGGSPAGRSSARPTAPTSAPGPAAPTPGVVPPTATPKPSVAPTAPPAAPAFKPLPGDPPAPAAKPTPPPADPTPPATDPTPAAPTPTPDPTPTPGAAPTETPGATVPPPESPADKRVREQLGEKVQEIRFTTPVSFEMALHFLRELKQMNINPNWAAMETVGITKNAEIALQLRDVTVETALRGILGKAAGKEGVLGFVIRRGVIEISTTADLSSATPSAPAPVTPPAAPDAPAPEPAAAPVAPDAPATSAPDTGAAP